MNTLAPLALLLLLPLGLAGCLPPQARPLLPINRRLEQNGSSREPSLAGRCPWISRFCCIACCHAPTRVNGSAHAMLHQIHIRPF